MIRYALVTSAALMLAPTPALFAQTGTDSPAPLFDPTKVVTPSFTDTQALNFYLQQNDQVSAEAELRRLRTKFPGWVPPDDLSSLSITQPSTEIDTIYRQIAAGELVEAGKTIQETQAAYANWAVPADMIRLLETAEGQIMLDKALDAGNAAEALEIASNTDGLLRCDRVNNAWRIAEAQAAQQAASAALGTYSAIVSACTGFESIVSTLEKSDAVATEDELNGLFDIALSRFPEAQDDLDALKTRLMEGRGGAPVQIAIAAEPSARPRARPSAGPTTGMPAPAPSAPVVVEVGRDAPPSAAPSGGGSSTGSGTQCLAATNGATSPTRLVERGWCAYDLDRPMEALAAFQSAEARLSGAQRRDARFGMALSYLKMNMTEEAARIAATTQLTRQQRVDTESIILDQRGVLAYKKKQYRNAIAYFDALEQVSGTLRRDLALLRGYAYLNSGNRAKAQSLFQTLHNQLATSETNRALDAAQ
ncbi:hypothetical protein [Pseudotabrizicola sp. 4114]|uniref:hypothetical protein n=1 Tax=Pseudotabrizicola sp. 4114 TaxID=2817731 RepID=UPI002859CA65|nr:tetratricopeptide (TPR) repeat protein [Pseudorhodobacter sp. 4114]